MPTLRPMRSSLCKVTDPTPRRGPMPSNRDLLAWIVAGLYAAATAVLIGAIGIISRRR